MHLDQQILKLLRLTHNYKIKSVKSFDGHLSIPYNKVILSTEAISRPSVDSRVPESPSHIKNNLCAHFIKQL